MLRAVSIRTGTALEMGVFKLIVMVDCDECISFRVIGLDRAPCQIVRANGETGEFPSSIVSEGADKRYKFTGMQTGHLGIGLAHQDNIPLLIVA